MAKNIVHQRHFSTQVNIVCDNSVYLEEKTIVFVPLKNAIHTKLGGSFSFL